MTTNNDNDRDGMDLDRFFPPWQLGMPAQRRFELPEKWQPQTWTADELKRRLDLAMMQAEAINLEANENDLLNAIALGYVTLDSKGRVVHASDDMVMVAAVAGTLFSLPTCEEPER